MKSFQIEGQDEFSKLINRSRLLGQDPNLVLYGGGNTSSKVEEVDHLGNTNSVLRIKGSGTDLKTIGEDGFSGVYLEEVLPLLNKEVMTDEEMVDYLAKCMVSATERRPSIETLLHAFLNAKHVDHVHSDAICTLTNHPNGEEIVKKVLGDNVAFVPYLRPGFELSKTVKQFENSYAIVLEHHGLVTWGETHEESYLKTIELEERARKYIEENIVKPTDRQEELLSEEEKNLLILTLRGVLSKEQRQIIHVDTSQLHLTIRDDVDAIATGGRSTLEHILRIGKDSLVLTANDDVKEKVKSFLQNYETYFNRNKDRIPAGYTMHSNIYPRVGLVEGLGCFGADITLNGAKRCTEIASHTHQVAANVLDLFSEIKTLTEEEIFDIDYWPLELYKLKLLPPVPSLAGYIMMIYGISNTRELEVLQKVLRKGAHVVAVLGEENESIEILKETYGLQLITVTGDVKKAIQAAINHFGGLDGVITGENCKITTEELEQLNAVFEKQDLTGFVITSQVEGRTLQSTAIIEYKSGELGLKGISELIGNL